MLYSVRRRLSNLWSHLRLRDMVYLFVVDHKRDFMVMIIGEDRNPGMVRRLAIYKKKGHIKTECFKL